MSDGTDGRRRRGGGRGDGTDGRLRRGGGRGGGAARLMTVLHYALSPGYNQN